MLVKYGVTTIFDLSKRWKGDVVASSGGETAVE